MKTVHVNTVTAKQQFSTLINQVFNGEGRIIVTSHGTPKAMIVPIENHSKQPQTHQQLLENLHTLQARIKNRRHGKYIDTDSIMDDIREGRVDDILSLR